MDIKQNVSLFIQTPSMFGDVTRSSVWGESGTAYDDEIGSSDGENLAFIHS